MGGTGDPFCSFLLYIQRINKHEDVLRVELSERDK